jgi:hypothetical protein
MGSRIVAHMKMREDIRRYADAGLTELFLEAKFIPGVHLDEGARRDGSTCTEDVANQGMSHSMTSWAWRQASTQGLSLQLMRTVGLGNVGIATYGMGLVVISHCGGHVSFWHICEVTSRFVTSPYGS